MAKSWYGPETAEDSMFCHPLIFHAGTPRVDIYLVAQLKIAIKMVARMRIEAAVGLCKPTHAHFMIAYATRLSLPKVKLFFWKTKMIDSIYASQRC